MADNTSPENPSKFSRYKQSMRFDWYILVLLIFLSVLGVAIFDATDAFGHAYWLAMVPVFFGACLYVEWHTCIQNGDSHKAVLFRQMQHWASLLIAVLLTLKLRDIGSLNNQTTGLILLLIFALTTFQAGITMGWLFKLLGILLAISVVLVAFAEHFIWLLIIVGVVMIIGYGFLKDHVGESKHDG